MSIKQAASAGEEVNSSELQNCRRCVSRYICRTLQPHRVRFSNAKWVDRSLGTVIKDILIRWRPSNASTATIDMKKFKQDDPAVITREVGERALSAGTARTSLS